MENKPTPAERLKWPANFSDLQDRLAKFTDDYIDEWTAEGNQLDGLHRIQDELLSEIITLINDLITEAIGEPMPLNTEPNTGQRIHNKLIEEQSQRRRDIIEQLKKGNE